MKQTKKISIIAILSLAVIVGGLFFSLTKQTKADLSGPGIQIRGGDSEDPCKNSEDSDSATNEACTMSGGSSGSCGSGVNNFSGTLYSPTSTTTYTVTCDP